MVLIVDTVQVEEKHAEEYLDLVQRLGVPMMTEAGASFLSCATGKGYGEPVDIQIVWSFPNHGEWNRIRKTLVLDPRWHEYGSGTAPLCITGTRRFLYPTMFSPGA
ncbi:MAG: hypothetical protein JWL73_2593 [Actinomycetia bacterium]|nr:hypothetical protein [Actinomycetes bacterium]